MISIYAVLSIFKMSSEELFCIASKDHTDQIKGLLKHLYVDKQFSDVTLVTDDQVVVPCHKFILSANSEVFRTVLENPSIDDKTKFLDKSQKIQNIDNKTIFLRGITHNILEQILKFCYTGLVDVDQEKVMEFFAAASDLKISQLKLNETLQNSEKVDMAERSKNEQEQQVTSKKAHENDFTQPPFKNETIQDSEIKNEEEKSKEANENDLSQPPYKNETLQNSEIKNEQEEETSIEADLDDDVQALKSVDEEILKMEKESKKFAQKLRRQKGFILRCPEPECDFQTVIKKDLREHRHSSHLKCSFCDKVFAFAAVRRQHELFHKKSYRHFCSHCTKGFVKKTQLIKHERVHTGERPYQCESCEKRFSTLTHLKTHTRVHTGETPYLCQECGQGFKFISTRNKHKCHQ